ncbi:hypothetical protein BANRA_05352 [Klebsiella pneumoniae]|nr:hypothetical protein BANRA_05352 [Klebsiella pneumoniae]
MFVLEVQRYRATSGFSVIAMNEDLIDTATNQSIQKVDSFSAGMSQCKGVIHPERCLHRVDGVLRIAAVIEAIAVQLPHCPRAAGDLSGSVMEIMAAPEPAPVFRPPLD